MWRRSNPRLLAETALACGCMMLQACATIPSDYYSFDCCSGIPAPPPEPAPSSQPATILAVTEPGVGANTDRLEWAPMPEDEEVVGPQSLRLVQYASEYNLGVPAQVKPEQLSNNGGASLIVEIPADPDAEMSFSISIDNGVLPANIPLTPSEVGPFLDATLADGSKVRVVLESTNQSTGSSGEELLWTAYGAWNVSGTTVGIGYGADFVTGVETPDGNMPTTGTATFDGFVRGTATLRDGPNLRVANLLGDATITADFATGTISGGAPTIIAIPLGQLPLPQGTLTPGPAQAWNSLLFAGSFAQGVNGFSGTATVGTAPGNSYSLSSAANGYFSGLFYGPAAEELGAVWNLHDSTGMASGVLAGGQ